MASSRQPPQWRRIYRQTITLIHKNLLIFWSAPISTLIRALIFPIVATVIFCELKNIRSSGTDSSDYGIASTSTPVKDLVEAMHDASKSKLVFIRNGISNDTVIPIIDGISKQVGMDSMNVLSSDDANDLYDLCKQTTSGGSDCFAAVLFLSFNETNVEYAIAIDGNVAQQYGYGNYKTGDNNLNNRIFPLQWALEAQIGGFPTNPKPSTQAWAGYFGPNTYDYGSSFSVQSGSGQENVFWLSLVSVFVAPVFILILIGAVYHLATFVATERETSIAELMAAQKVSITPRMLSTFLSFFAVYFPGFLISSILLTQLLFTRTSDILFLFLILLAGASLITSAHFLASFFGKAQLAGLYTSVLTFALALVILAATLTSVNPTAQVLALSLIFPPITWATLIADTALREANLKALSLVPGPFNPNGDRTQFLDGYLYIVFFIVQIIVFSIATYFVEKGLWGVKRTFARIDGGSDVALRCTGLSKTYHAKHPWYWPFMKKGKTVVAVDNLDLEVKKGSVTFLLGPNGGGKTTTLKCVAGMTSMDSGSRLELNEAGLVFGICPQHNVFWQNLTVQQHIKIWRKLKTAAFENTTADDDDVLAECDLLEKVDAPAKTLSGGQMRKLQLAIAFVGGSKVCCIDEASSGLDPLSRRNIWNIIQRGHALRTILVTTHFLDEADVLADHIAIVYKGKLVCEGPGTSLKAQFGDNYLIRSNEEVGEDAMVWRTSNSAAATKKILELESLENDKTYDVVFPTLEQVFLKVTSDSNTAIHAHGGDGYVGEEEANTVIDEKIFALETENARDIDLDVGRSIGLARQVAALFQKRYILLLQKSGWISYGINLIIPIIIGAALVKFLHRFDSLQTCSVNRELFTNGTVSPTFPAGHPEYREFGPLLPYNPSSIYASTGEPSGILGPPSAWSGTVQEALYLDAISPLITSYSYSRTSDNTTIANKTLRGREFVNDINALVTQITNYSGTGYEGFGIFSPTPETATLFYSGYNSIYTMGEYANTFNLITNRVANSTTTTGTAREVTTSLRSMRHITNTVDFRSMPIAVLITLAFICAASIAVIYPAFEKNNRVRALHYCNGVSPFALWLGYLLFDIQLIIIQAFIVWGIVYAGSLTRLYYASSYILGVFILFGIATYLGTYVLSLFTKKAAFAIAAGLHILLFVLYLVGYIINQSVGDGWNRHMIYNALQDGLGLSSPGANLARSLFLTSNSFEILCGKYGDNDISNPFSYNRYGSVYANLLIQIIFLAAFLAIYEYGSADWFRRNITHRGVPARLHYIVDSGDAAVAGADPRAAGEKNLSAPSSTEILNVSRISKFFGKIFAVENVSFSIASNSTLALLGGNGAGKTTVINMIRGELKPNFGDIFLDGTSVLRQPHKARLQMGVCPQDDAIDNLTVRQTLNFYATVKGLKDVAGNVDKVLNALNITVYQNVAVKDLSGGTRRKLSVAIALLGNPRVLLLDEPSTGQDAGAKRILWRALQDISHNRAILLTTHSMEEAEALATNVAIMGTKMLATGSLPSLQETYGGAYSVRAVRTVESSRDEVEGIIKEKFEGAVTNYFDSHGQVQFNLPHERSRLGSIMGVMEGLKGDVIEQADEEEEAAPGTTVGGSAAGGSLAPANTGKGAVRVLTDYTVTGPTLEEVFMNVARENGTASGV